MSDLVTKNPRTNQMEVIKVSDLQMEDDRFFFFVESEADAYKAAYQYRYNKTPPRVDYSQSLGKWFVSVTKGEL